MDEGQFHKSLDLTDADLGPFVPQLLRGLWALGSMPAYVIELVERNIRRPFRSVTDLGCGKGAVLIQLAEKFDFHGVGIDIVPEFIVEARALAVAHRVGEKLTFACEDMAVSVQRIRDQDLIIYGHDAEVLGDLEQTLRQLKSCLAADGYLILECMFSRVNTDVLPEKVMLKNIVDAGYQIVDRIDWDVAQLRETNESNNRLIEANVADLIQRFPDKAEMFQHYLAQQLEECRRLESEHVCTLLLSETPDR